MYRLRKILAIIIPMALILTLFSCNDAEDGGFLGSIDAPAEMKIDGERYGVAFSAVIEIGGGEAKMTFTAPESFSGIEVTSAGGVWNSSLDGIKIAGISAEMLGAPLLPFTEIGAALSAERITDEDSRALTLIVTENGRFEYYIDSKSGCPVRVVEKNAAGETVMSFEVTEYIIE